MKLVNSISEFIALTRGGRPVQSNKKKIYRI